MDIESKSSLLNNHFWKLKPFVKCCGFLLIYTSYVCIILLVSIIVIIHLLCTINQLRYTRDANIPSLLIKDYYAIKCQWPFRKYKLCYFIKKISRQLVHAVQKCCISFLLHYLSKQGRICICEVNGMVRYNSFWQ